MISQNFNWLMPNKQTTLAYTEKYKELKEPIRNELIYTSENALHKWLAVFFNFGGPANNISRERCKQCHKYMHIFVTASFNEIEQINAC